MKTQKQDTTTHTIIEPVTEPAKRRRRNKTTRKIAAWEVLPGGTITVPGKWVSDLGYHSSDRKFTVERLGSTRNYTVRLHFTYRGIASTRLLDPDTEVILNRRPRNSAARTERTRRNRRK